LVSLLSSALLWLFLIVDQQEQELHRNPFQCERAARAAQSVKARIEFEVPTNLMICWILARSNPQTPIPERPAHCGRFPRIAKALVFAATCEDMKIKHFDSTPLLSEGTFPGHDASRFRSVTGSWPAETFKESYV
jgi:hypothetical protein